MQKTDKLSSDTGAAKYGEQNEQKSYRYKEFVNAECIKFHNIHKYPLNIHKCADAAGSDYAKSQHRTQKHQELGVIVRGFARLQQVDAGVGGE